MFKNKYLISLLISILLFIILRLPYRDYIYNNNLYDFHIADTAPNFFAILMFIFLNKWENNNNSNIKLAISSFFGLTIYEFFIQQHIYNATIDYLDVLASFVAAILAYFICQKINRLDKNRIK